MDRNTGDDEGIPDIETDLFVDALRSLGEEGIRSLKEEIRPVVDSLRDASEDEKQAYLKKARFRCFKCGSLLGVVFGPCPKCGTSKTANRLYHRFIEKELLGQ